MLYNWDALGMQCIKSVYEISLGLEECEKEYGFKAENSRFAIIFVEWRRPPGGECPYLTSDVLLCNVVRITPPKHTYIFRLRWCATKTNT